MTSDFGNIDRRNVQELNEDQLLNELDCPVECPDLTRSIMGRLGYMKASPNVVRRARIRRHVKRGLVGVAAMIALGLGIFIHNHSPNARRQVGPSLTEAVNHDITLHQQRISNAFQTIRNFTPRNQTLRNTKPITLTPVSFSWQKHLQTETEMIPNLSDKDDSLIAKAPSRGN